MHDRVYYQQIAEVPGLVLSTARFSDFRFDRHFHLDYHIGFITDGVQRQRFKGNSALLGRGGIALMPPGEIHDGASEGGDAYTLRTFRIPSDLLDKVKADICGVEREPTLAGAILEAPALAAQFVSLHRAMQYPHGGTMSLAIQTEWLSLLEILLQQARVFVPNDIRGALSPVHWSRVKEYCSTHLGEKISLDGLAVICGMGQFQFLRQFKQSVGMTPHAWLVRLRLERACALLARTQQTIAEVAQEVGFYDQSHFNRAFRQAFGVSPSQY